MSEYDKLIEQSWLLWRLCSPLSQFRIFIFFFFFFCCLLWLNATKPLEPCIEESERERATKMTNVLMVRMPRNTINAWRWHRTCHFIRIASKCTARRATGAKICTRTRALSLSIPLTHSNSIFQFGSRILSSSFFLFLRTCLRFAFAAFSFDFNLLFAWIVNWMLRSLAVL